MTTFANLEQLSSVRTKINRLLFDTRAELVAHIAANTAVNGAEYRAAGVSYIGRTGATDISDLPGLVVGGNASSLQAFGAVGDGVADDTAAVTAAITAGVPLEWGDGVYRITAPIDVSVASLRFRSSGARIVYDGASGAQAAVKITVGSAGVVDVDGDFAVDADSGAYTCLWIEQTGALPMAVSARGLRCLNARRSGTTHTGGGGLRITGRLSMVRLENPVISECRLATGAGVVGVDGVAGINIRAAVHADGFNPANVTIINPDIRGVYSEDATYIADQDGIIAWCDRDATTEPVGASVQIVGGYFENCWGRALKIQTERAHVTGVKIRRYTGSSTAPTNPDVDLQVGGGHVQGVDCIYDGFTPYSVVGFACPTNTSKTTPHGMASGVQAEILGGATLPFAFSNSARDFLAQVVRYSDVSIRGSVGSVIRFNAGNSGTGFYCFAARIDAAPTTALIQSGSDAGSGRAVVRDCVNTGAAVALFNRASSSFTPTVSAENCFGWTETVAQSDTAQNVTRFGPIFPLNNNFGGAHRVVSQVVADGETFILGRRSVATNYSGLMAISLSTSRNGQALVTADNSAAVILAQASTEFVAGGTSEPGSGNWRVWTGTDGPRITNRSGSSRTVTVWQFG